MSTTATDYQVHYDEEMGREDEDEKNQKGGPFLEYLLVEFIGQIPALFNELRNKRG